jgi:amino-acid N-acetyltransferase
LISYRKAGPADVPTIFKLISHYAAERVMLARTLEELFSSAREFTVAVEDGRVVGCGSLKFYDGRVAEIRSLAVEPGHTSRGLGGGLVKRLVREAKSLGLETVFALTSAPEFFNKCGFRETAREKFPTKIQRDCLNCDLYPACTEKTVAIRVGQPKPRAYARPLAEEVPALRPA